MTDMRLNLPVELKLLHPDAIVPKYQTAGAAAFDLHALIEKEAYGRRRVVLHVGDTLIVRTGIAVNLRDPNLVLAVTGRSGHGFKKGVRLANCLGVIDSDYQGEIMVALHADRHAMEINHGDRIAQGMLIPVFKAEFDLVPEFATTTERGEQGFGSTGVA